MTLFQKIVSVTLASVVLFVSVVLMLTLGGILDVNLGSDIMENILEGDFLSKILFAVFAILSLILENESGKLIISKESLESLIAGVGKEIEGVESVASRTFIDSEKNVIVEVNVVVGREAVLKEISAELQRNVKSALKQTADLDVRFVNIKIKNISNKKSKKNVTAEKNMNESGKKE